MLLRKRKLFSVVSKRLEQICSFCVSYHRKQVERSVTSSAKPGTYHGRKRRFSEIPGPPTLPLIGGIHNRLRWGRLHGLSHYEVSDTLQRMYGNVVMETPLPGFKVIHLFDADDFETVFRNDGRYPKRIAMEILKKFYEVHNNNVQGLATADGPEWARLRRSVSKRLLLPDSLSVQLKDQLVIAHDFVSRIRDLKQKDGYVEDFMPEIRKYTLESIGYTCFNKRLGSFDAISGKDHGRILDVMETMMPILEKDRRQIPFFKLFQTPTFKRVSTAMNEIKKEIMYHIEEALERLDNTQDARCAANGRNTLLQHLLSATDLTRDEIFTIISDLFGGGIDTTSCLIANCLFLLGKHPDVQDKLHEEVQSQLDGVSASVRIPYLKSVVRETLRLLPVAPANARLLGDDLKLSGYIVPKKTLVVMHTGWTSRQAQYYEKPDQFFPERWLRNAGSLSIHPFATLPYGFGPRSCIGKRLAEQETYVLLLKLIQQYKVETLTKDLKIVTSILNKPGVPLKFRFTERRR